MEQIIHLINSNSSRMLRLPDPNSRVMAGIPWGRIEEPFTPAFWAAQVFLTAASNHSPGSFRLGNSFREEAAACLLGGHGIPAEVGLAAFAELRKQRFFDGRSVRGEQIMEVLEQPLTVGSRRCKYRFARQKSHYLASLLQRLADPPENVSHHELRNWLMQTPGVGLKTASWIIRNWYNSDEVAIIDIHVHRAGLICGIFSADDTLPRDYLSMEHRFLGFASAINVRPSMLDATIWRQMRYGGKLVRRRLSQIFDRSSSDAAA